MDVPVTYGLHGAPLNVAQMWPSDFAILCHSTTETQLEKERETFLKIGDQKQIKYAKSNTWQDKLYQDIVLMHMNNLADLPQN